MPHELGLPPLAERFGSYYAALGYSPDQAAAYALREAEDLRANPRASQRTRALAEVDFTLASLGEMEDEGRALRSLYAEEGIRLALSDWIEVARILEAAELLESIHFYNPKTGPSPSQMRRNAARMGIKFDPAKHPRDHGKFSHSPGQVGTETHGSFGPVPAGTSRSGKKYRVVPRGSGGYALQMHKGGTTWENVDYAADQKGAALHLRRRLQEAKDSSPDSKLPNKPGKTNWVEKAGGLPRYIRRIAEDIHAKNGDTGRAIAIAVGQVRNWCHGHGGNVSAKTKAKACAAVAEWEAKKAKSKAKTATEAASSSDRLKVGHAAYKRLVLAEGLMLTLADASASVATVERTLDSVGQLVGERPDTIDEAAEIVRDIAEIERAVCEGTSYFTRLEETPKPKKPKATMDGYAEEKARLIKKGMPEKMAHKAAMAKCKKLAEADDGETPEVAAARQEIAVAIARGLDEGMGIEEATLTAGDRKNLSADAFVFPKDRRYPIHDISHARNALARASGKPEEAQVKKAVYARYPSLRKLREDAPYPISIGDPVRESLDDLALGRSGVVIAEGEDQDGAYVYDVRWADGQVQHHVRQFNLRVVRDLTEAVILDMASTTYGPDFEIKPHLPNPYAELQEAEDEGLHVGRGDNGDNVTHLQNRLHDLGYGAGAKDGRYGDLTAGAVRRFQGEHGLRQTGKVGPETVQALRAPAKFKGREQPEKPGKRQEARGKVREETSKKGKKRPRGATQKGKPPKDETAKQRAPAGRSGAQKTANGKNRKGKLEEFRAPWNEGLHPRHHGQFAKKIGGLAPSGHTYLGHGVHVQAAATPGQPYTVSLRHPDPKKRNEVMLAKDAEHAAQIAEHARKHRTLKGAPGHRMVEAAYKDLGRAAWRS